jgi:hypothetical protein
MAFVEQASDQKEKQQVSARKSVSVVKLERDNNKRASGQHGDPPVSFIVVVETARSDRGKVTNSHSKQAAKRPNKLLKGCWACIAKTKKQTDNLD